jgi:OmpA-OmpF porin, OOP family
MALFDSVLADVAGRFGLGSQASPLLREVLQLMTGQPGGIGGFLEQMKSSGLGTEVASWLGDPNAAPLSGQQMEKALGASSLGAIAGRLGLAGGATGAAMGYLLPKVVGLLTPGKVIPSGIPAAVSDVLAAPPHVPPHVAPHPVQYVQQVAPRHVEVIKDAPSFGRWAIPIAAALGLAGLLWYVGASRTPQQVASLPTPAVSQNTLPAASQVASVIPPRLVLRNENGVITYSGIVRDESTRSSIVDALKAVYGSDNIKGSIAVEPNASPASWLIGFRTACENFRTPGTHAVFDGNSLSVGGLPEPDRDRIADSLKSVFGTGIVVAGLANRGPEAASGSTVPANFAAKDLLTRLNQTSVNFATGSAEVPPESKALLQQVAAMATQLPADTIIEIDGHADSSGDSAANQQLSQRRADAVRQVLVDAGMNPAALVAKGYGSGAAAGTEPQGGAAGERRVDYTMVKP